jgi:hypothetical protein
LSIRNVDILSSNTGTAAVSVFTGIQIRSSVNSGGGSVTTNQAIVIEAQTIGTNNYGIRINGAQTYGIFVDASLSRFDGDGTHVFELPADATDPTGGGGAAAGRFPVLVGGSTQYVAYY